MLFNCLLSKINDEIEYKLIVTNHNKTEASPDRIFASDKENRPFIRLPIRRYNQIDQDSTLHNIM